MVPKLPTDNLYKFVALSGLVLLMGAGYLRITPQMQLHRDVAALNSEITSLNSISARLADDVKSLAPDSKGPFIVNGVLYETTIEARAALHVKQLEVNDLAAKFRLQQEVLKASSDNLETLWYGTQAAQWLGFLLMVGGFTAWYFKVQRYQDRIIVNESRSANQPADSSIAAVGAESSVEIDP